MSVEERALGFAGIAGEFLIRAVDSHWAIWLGTFALASALAPVVLAQEPPASPESSSKQDSAKPKPNTDSALKSAPDQPKWDPMRAEKVLEVGKYYMRKGDVDAAIDRFQDAVEAKPGYAIPFLYLGDAYEKKGQKKPAVKAYERYLDLYPHAEDGDKVRKKIEKLHKEIDKEKKDRVSGSTGRAGDQFLRG